MSAGYGSKLGEVPEEQVAVVVVAGCRGHNLFEKINEVRIENALVKGAKLMKL